MTASDPDVPFADRRWHATLTNRAAAEVDDVLGQLAMALADSDRLLVIKGNRMTVARAVTLFGRTHDASLTIKGRTLIVRAPIRARRNLRSMYLHGAVKPPVGDIRETASRTLLGWRTEMRKARRAGRRKWPEETYYKLRQMAFGLADLYGAPWEYASISPHDDGGYGFDIEPPGPPPRPPSHRFKSGPTKRGWGGMTLALVQVLDGIFQNDVVIRDLRIAPDHSPAHNLPQIIFGVIEGMTVCVDYIDPMERLRAIAKVAPDARLVAGVDRRRREDR